METVILFLNQHLVDILNLLGDKTFEDDKMTAFF